MSITPIRPHRPEDHEAVALAVATFAVPLGQISEHARFVAKTQRRPPKHNAIIREMVATPLEKALARRRPEELATFAAVLEDCTRAILDDVLLVEPPPSMPWRRRLKRLIWPHLDL